MQPRECRRKGGDVLVLGRPGACREKGQLGAQEPDALGARFETAVTSAAVEALQSSVTERPSRVTAGSPRAAIRSWRSVR